MTAINNCQAYESGMMDFLASALRDMPFRIEAFNGSGTNRHFLVHANKTYFLKVFTTNALQVVDRAQQFSIQQQMARQNMALRPLALSDCEQYWLEEAFLADQPQTQPDTLALATALAGIHRANVVAAELDLAAEWQRYCVIAGDDYEQYGGQTKALLAVYQQHCDFCFCHNDLHFSHILSVHPCLVVDWEYAAIGNRYFDIAACIKVNALDNLAAHRLQEEYAQQTGISVQDLKNAVQGLMPVVDFTNKLWHNAFFTIN